MGYGLWSKKLAIPAIAIVIMWHTLIFFYTQYMRVMQQTTECFEFLSFCKHFFLFFITIECDDVGQFSKSLETQQKINKKKHKQQPTRFVLKIVRRVFFIAF